MSMTQAPKFPKMPARPHLRLRVRLWMSDQETRSDLGGAMLDIARAAWSADPSLDSALAEPTRLHLILDETACLVLHASQSAEPLRAAIADEQGALAPRLRIAEQIGAAAVPPGVTRLGRLRLDPRGLGRPIACLIARAPDAAGRLVLVLPTEPIPRLRQLAPPIPEPAAEPPVPAAPEPEAEPDLELPSDGTRFLWSSDAQDVVGEVRGAAAALVAPLAGRAWQALAQDGSITGDELLDAITERRTFRALPLILRRSDVAEEIAFTASGSPVARPNQPYAGFSGFGMVIARRRSAAPHQPAVANLAPEPQPPPEDTVDASPELQPELDAPVATLPLIEVPAAPPPGTASNAVDDLRARVAAEFASKLGNGALFGLSALSSTGLARGPADKAPTFIWDTRADPAARTAPDEPTLPDPPPEGAELRGGPTRGASLSTHENDAFHEIARALGARFAGEDDGPDRTGSPGAVIAPFPVVAAPAPDSIDSAIVAALDRLPAGVLVHRGGRVLFANRRFLDVTGYRDKAGLEAAQALSPLLEEPHALDAAILQDAPVSVRTGGGELIELLAERSRVDWDGGPAELLLVRSASPSDPNRQEIAQGLLQARDAARDREAQTLLDHIEEGVATLDETGRVLALNRSAAALFGGHAREMVGGPLADLFAPAGGEAVAASLREAVLTGTSTPCEIAMRTVPDSLRLRIVRLASAPAARFCATLRQAAPAPASQPPEEELRFAPLAAPPEPTMQRKADFLAKVSHEIRTPATGIVGSAHTLLGEPGGALGGERHREHLRDMQASGEQILGVADDLLELARLEAGETKLLFSDLALNEVIARCIEKVQPLATRGRIVMRTSLSPDLGLVRADERTVQQATLTVMVHALRLTEPGGQVIVSTTSVEQGEIAFRVRDTGIGMSPEELEDALQPFRQAQTAAPRPAGGSGLGLTLSKALIEANQGRFRITSRRNEGTLVEMLFPALRSLSA